MRAQQITRHGSRAPLGILRYLGQSGAGQTCGLRLLECLHMRVKDIDFERNEITVRDGKGQKDRVTMLPASC